jgi:hypothetical protein
MKNIIDVIRSKEQEILQVRKELDALRIAARLLSEEDIPATSTKPHSRIFAMPESDELLDLNLPEQPTA